MRERGSGGTFEAGRVCGWTWTVNLLSEQWIDWAESNRIESSCENGV